MNFAGLGSEWNGFISSESPVVLFTVLCINTFNFDKILYFLALFKIFPDLYF